MGAHHTHGSKSGTSFNVDPQQGLYHCWNCGEGGDVFTWVMNTRGCSFPEALRILAQRAGIPLPEWKPEERAKQEALWQERRELEKIFLEAARFYHAQLTPELKAWAFEKWGLRPETLDYYLVGFAPVDGTALKEHLKARGFAPDLLKKTGLFVQVKDKGLVDLFQGRLIFPYWQALPVKKENDGRAAGGIVVYFIGRQTKHTPDETWEAGKYKKQLTHSERHPYVSQAVANYYFYGEHSTRSLQDGSLFVTEGVADCLAALQAGLPCISPVTTRFSEATYPRLLTLSRKAKIVYIINDNEESKAGEKGALATAEFLEANRVNVRLVELPMPQGVDKLDLAEYLRDHSPEELRVLTKKAKTAWEIRLAALPVDNDDYNNFLAAREFTKEVLHSCPDEDRVAAFIEYHIKQKFGLKARQTNALLRKYQTARKSQKGPKPEISGTFPRLNGEAEKQDGPLAGTPYLISGGRLWYRKDTKDGPVAVPLSNFTAQVIRDVSRDDGAEVTRIFEITGQLANGKPLPRIVVPAKQFLQMNWVADWGVEARIAAGQALKDRLREAIQIVSENAEKVSVYTHIGWREISGRWVYLHAGGAVGAEGILVEPDADGLKRYVLPTDGDVEEGLKASLRLLEIGPPKMTMPLWSAVWRAPTACIVYPTVTIFLYGLTGSFKSTVVALVLSHYGGPFNKDNLPADWTGSENSLEKLSFLCRDALLVIDDYAPEVHPREAAKLERKVNRIIGQIGNRSARSRLKSDLTLRPDFTPNCLLISTGEQLPLAIQSRAARILPIPFDRKEINLEKLTASQAEAHLLPQAMRGYLEWLAPQMDELARTLPERFRELRAKAVMEGHPRLPEAVAHLQLGAELGLRYMVEAGVLSKTEAEEIEALSWETLLDLAREHGKLLEEERPALKFVHTLDAIFAQGKAHLVDRQTGDRPPMAEHFGWTYLETGDGQGEYRRGGDLLGWADKDGVYLIPEAAWRAVSEYLRSSGGFPVRERTLRDMLAREGLLIKDEKNGRTTRGVRMQGRPKRVLHLDLQIYISLLHKAVTPVTGAAKHTATRDSLLPPTGNTDEKAVTKTVTEGRVLPKLLPPVTAPEEKPVTSETLEAQGFEGISEEGVTGVTGCEKGETYKEKLFDAGEDEGEDTDELDDIPF